MYYSREIKIIRIDLKFYQNDKCYKKKSNENARYKKHSNSELKKMVFTGLLIKEPKKEESVNTIIS